MNKDADGYLLTVYTDEEMTEFEDSWNLGPDEIPVIIRLTADQKYWFTVQAYRVDKEGVPIETTLSNLAVYDGSIKTYAVKDNLFLEVVGRTETTVSLAWSNEASDYEEVTDLQAVPVKGGKTVKKELSAAEATAAAATIEGLEPSTEYQITLFYMSASRGARDTWTKAEKGEATLITDETGLKTANWARTARSPWLPVRWNSPPTWPRQTPTCTSRTSSSTVQPVPVSWSTPVAAP